MAIYSRSVPDAAPLWCTSTSWSLDYYHCRCYEAFPRTNSSRFSPLPLSNCGSHDGSLLPPPSNDVSLCSWRWYPDLFRVKIKSSWAFTYVFFFPHLLLCILFCFRSLTFIFILFLFPVHNVVLCRPLCVCGCERPLHLCVRGKRDGGRRGGVAHRTHRLLFCHSFPSSS